MDEDIIKYKIEKAIDLICQLYKSKIITDVFIVGSVAKGTARKESDIDIYLINPLFKELVEVEPLFEGQFLPLSPRLEETEIEELLATWRANIDLVNILKNIGVEFKQIERKDEIFWYQLYRGELFHLMTRDRSNPFIIEEGIKITKDLCFSKQE